MKTEQTLAYAGAEVETDPKSEVVSSLPATQARQATILKPKSVGQGKQPPRKNTKLLFGAGAAGFLLVLLGVILVIKNYKGETVAEVKVPTGNTAEVKVPAGGSVQVKPDDTPPKTIRSSRFLLRPFHRRRRRLLTRRLRRQQARPLRRSPSHPSTPPKPKPINKPGPSIWARRSRRPTASARRWC